MIFLILLWQLRDLVLLLLAELKIKKGEVKTDASNNSDSV